MIAHKISFGVVAMMFLAPAVAASPPDSIRGQAWGGPPSSLGQSTLVEDDGSLKCYRKNNDDLTVGAASLSGASYCYYNDRLTSVFLKFNGYTNFDGLKKTLTQKYGEGSQPNQFMQKYTWTVSSVYINFEYHEIGNNGELMYLYVPIMNERNHDQEELQKKGADKL